MTATEALRAARGAGLVLWAKPNGNLGVKGPKEVRAALVPSLVPLAPQILRLLAAADSAPAQALAFGRPSAPANPTTPEGRHFECLRAWTDAHEARRRSLAAWPARGGEVLDHLRPDLLRALEASEATADALTETWRTTGVDASTWRGSISEWVAAYAAAGVWFANACHECGRDNVTAVVVDAEGLRRCRVCLS